MVLGSAAYLEMRGLDASGRNLLAGHLPSIGWGGGVPSRVVWDAGKLPSSTELVHSTTPAITPPMSPVLDLGTGRSLQVQVKPGSKQRSRTFVREGT